MCVSECECVRKCVCVRERERERALGRPDHCKWKRVRKNKAHSADFNCRLKHIFIFWHGGSITVGCMNLMSSSSSISPECHVKSAKWNSYITKTIVNTGCMMPPPPPPTSPAKSLKQISAENFATVRCTLCQGMKRKQNAPLHCLLVFHVKCVDPTNLNKSVCMCVCVCVCVC